MSFSQVGQDIFALEKSTSKYFLEIGSNDPIKNNNTYLLSQNGWKGIMVEYDKSFEDQYKIYRPESLHILQDARTINYRKILDDNNFPEVMGYLSFDLDVDNRSTLDVLELLDQTVFDKYKFQTITFEHDIYTGNFYDTQEKSREIFKRRGYILSNPDVCVYWNNQYCKFEDWYLMNND